MKKKQIRYTKKEKLLATLILVKTTAEELKTQEEAKEVLPAVELTCDMLELAIIYSRNIKDRTGRTEAQTVKNTNRLLDKVYSLKAGTKEDEERADVQPALFLASSALFLCSPKAESTKTPLLKNLITLAESCLIWIVEQLDSPMWSLDSVHDEALFFCKKLEEKVG